MPRDPLPFPTVLVASSTDPYGSAAYGEQCASDWGAGFINVGDRGHINNIGDWPQGKMMLAVFTAGL